MHKQDEVIRFRVPAELRALAEEYATKRYISMSAVIRQALAEKLRKEGMLLDDKGSVSKVSGSARFASNG